MLACPDPGCRALGLGRHGNVGGGRCEAEDGHVAVDGFVLTCPDTEGLVPDANVARIADGPVEAAPRLEVRQITIPCESVERVEVTPVLDEGSRPTEPLVIPEAPQLGML